MPKKKKKRALFRDRMKQTNCRRNADSDWTGQCREMPSPPAPSRRSMSPRTVVATWRPPETQWRRTVNGANRLFFVFPGTFQGQWMRGMRHGYGVRTSARFGMASHSKPNKPDIRNSLSSLGSDDAHNKAGSGSDDQAAGSEGRDKKLDDTRGGFVLKANSDEQPSRRKNLVSKSTQGLKRTFMSVSKDESREIAVWSVTSTPNAILKTTLRQCCRVFCP